MPYTMNDEFLEKDLSYDEREAHKERHRSAYKRGSGILSSIVGRNTQEKIREGYGHKVSDGIYALSATLSSIYFVPTMNNWEKAKNTEHAENALNNVREKAANDDDGIARVVIETPMFSKGDILEDGYTIQYENIEYSTLIEQAENDLTAAQNQTVDYLGVGEGVILSFLAGAASIGALALASALSERFEAKANEIFKNAGDMLFNYNEKRRAPKTEKTAQPK